MRTAFRRPQPLLLSLAICTCLSPVAGFAQTSSTAHAIHIAEGDLNHALERLGEQSGVAILYEPRLVQGLAAPGIDGTLTPQQSLNLLLSGYQSTLTWQQVNGTTFVIVAREGEPFPEAPAPSRHTADAVVPERNATNLDAVKVVGRGSTRAIGEISSEYIQTQTPGITPQMLLGDLPGVNVQMSDPYGMYELNDSLRVRGFTMTQIGMSIDGVPYYSSLYEGGSIAHYVLSENLGGIEASPGSGDVTQPAMSALGGSIRYYSIDPTEDISGKFSATGGTYGFNRVFARYNTGQWWQGGPTAYVSAARTRVAQWENYKVVSGEGELEADHFETKIKQGWGNGNSLTLKFSYDARNDWDTKNVDTAGNPTEDGELYAYPSTNNQAAWAGYWRNGRRDQLYTAIAEFHPSDLLTIKVTPYYNKHDAYLYYGVGSDTAESYYESAQESGRTDTDEPNGSTAQRRVERGGDRFGATTDFTWALGANVLQAGLWLQSDSYYYWYPLQNSDPDTGEIISDSIISMGGDYTAKTKTAQFYLKDSLSLLDDRLNLQFGAKGLYVKRHFYGYANQSDWESSTYRDVRAKYQDFFQPQAGLTWKFNDRVEGFLNYAENFSAVTVSAMASAVYNADIKPESSQNLDLGIRYAGDTLAGSVSIYGIKYHNRIISLSTYSRASSSSSSTYLNVNGVNTYGMEFSGDWRPLPAWKFASSLSLSQSKYADDYYSFDSTTGEQNILVEVDGNYLPDQPKVQGKLTSYYQQGHWSANLGVEYMGARYGDTKNTIRVHPYSLWNGGVAYSGLPGEKLERMKFNLSVYNIFDKVYISTINSNESSATFKRGYPRAVYGSIEYSF